MEKAIEFNKPVFLYFIDLETLDRLELKDVLKNLKVNNVPNDLILFIRDIFTANFDRIKVN